MRRHAGNVKCLDKAKWPTARPEFQGLNVGGGRIESRMGERRVLERVERLGLAVEGDHEGRQDVAPAEVQQMHDTA